MLIYSRIKTLITNEKQFFLQFLAFICSAKKLYEILSYKCIEGDFESAEFLFSQTSFGVIRGATRSVLRVVRDAVSRPELPLSRG